MTEAPKEIDDPDTHASLIYEDRIGRVSVDEVANAICRLIQRQTTPAGNGHGTSISTAAEARDRLVVSVPGDIDSKNKGLEMVRLHRAHHRKSDGLERNELGGCGIWKLSENPDPKEVGILAPGLGPALYQGFVGELRFPRIDPVGVPEALGFVSEIANRSKQSRKRPEFLVGFPVATQMI